MTDADDEMTHLVMCIIRAKFVSEFEKLWKCLTQYAGLAQVGDRLSIVSSGEDRRSAWAGDALCVRCWVFNWVQEGGPYLIIGCGVSGTTPDGENQPKIFIYTYMFLCVFEG